MTDYKGTCYHCGKEYYWTGSRGYYTNHYDIVKYVNERGVFFLIRRAFVK